MSSTGNARHCQPNQSRRKERGVRAMDDREVGRWKEYILRLEITTTLSVHCYYCCCCCC